MWNGRSIQGRGGQNTALLHAAAHLLLGDILLLLSQVGQIHFHELQLAQSLELGLPVLGLPVSHLLHLDQILERRSQATWNGGRLLHARQDLRLSMKGLLRRKCSIPQPVTH